jgi:SlyX protein
METPPDTERRLIDLEVKASFAEDLLEQLNRTVFRQQQQIEQLAREIAELRQRIPPDTGTPTGVVDELPPHY